MRKYHLTGLALFAISILLISCAAQRAEVPFRPYDFSAKVQSGEYTKKIDNFLVILDASGSMNQYYKGQRKFDIARDIVSGMNQTIPDLGYTSPFASAGSQFDQSYRKMRVGTLSARSASLETTLVRDEGRVSRPRPTVMWHGSCRELNPEGLVERPHTANGLRHYCR